MADFTLDARKLVPVLHYDGTPITARFIAGEIEKRVGHANVVPMNGRAAS
jgi:2-oxoglutarate ferredoxin oxidoreductase subunit alpha